MSKSDDIPEDVWDKATAQPLVSTGDIDDDISEAIARAIMAERQRCLTLCIMQGSQWGSLEAAVACDDLADKIRAGGLS